MSAGSRPSRAHCGVRLRAAPATSSRPCRPARDVAAAPLPPRDRGRRRASRRDRGGRGGPTRGRSTGHRADLRRAHDQPVVAHLPAQRAQPVAVERGADAPAVGEHEPGGAVPRVGEARVVAEEVAHAAAGGHAGPPTPRARASRRRDECRGRPARAARRRSRACRSRSRRDRARGRNSSSGPRPASSVPRRPRAIMRSSLPRDGVDLAVVAQHAERLGPLPRRRRVRREAAVEDRRATRRSRRRRDRDRTRRAGR